MKDKITIEARRFPVVIKNISSGEVINDMKKSGKQRLKQDAKEV